MCEVPDFAPPMSECAVQALRWRAHYHRGRVTFENVDAKDDGRQPSLALAFMNEL
jgi:hypothetical protein